jgi:alpha-galactosidase
MTSLGLLIAVLLVAFCSYPCASQDATLPAPSTVAVDLWKAGNPLPFSFKYDDKDSTQILAAWQRTEERAASDGGETRRISFADPETKLKVVVEVRTFKDFSAVDWVLHFTNQGDKDTPIIDNVQPLNCKLPGVGESFVHWALGSAAVASDFEPRRSNLNPGDTVNLRSNGGRSSDGNSPFFNIQMGDRGIIGGIGWTGNWNARFACDRQSKIRSLTAGMRKTHFLLHPGETVRSPRILLLDWNGSVVDAHNLWRRFLLAYYSPRDTKGQTVVAPLCFGSWGSEPLDSKRKMIETCRQKEIPFDVYWVDADWYGTDTPKEGIHPNDMAQWWRKRGSWTPNPRYYPNGLEPLGEILKKNGYEFLLWVEPEQADPGSDLLLQHPDWFFLPPNTNNPGTALLNLGKPEARKDITDIISKIIAEAGLSWYRQDFNVDPERSWTAADKADRVGISEMLHIAGLYAFWDELRQRHPGLQVDNCASGGRRIDIETLSRSVPLFRSDMACNFFDPIHGQMQTQALCPWAPINTAVYGGVAPGTPNEGTSLIYAIRSSYCSGWLYGTDRLSINVMKAAAEEYKQVRPYFYGDFYPLISYSSSPELWAAWQLHRPEQKSGVVILLRRQGSPLTSMRLGLERIQPDAQYTVDVRTGLGAGTVKKMSGKELVEMQVTVPDRPGSALVFYRQE